MVIMICMYLGAFIALLVDPQSRKDFEAGQHASKDPNLDQYVAAAAATIHPFYGIFIVDILYM